MLIAEPLVCVITCILPEHKQLLSRNLVYTDITRAKKECILYYNKDTLKEALEIEAAYLRRTYLAEEIQRECKLYKLINAA